MSEAQPKTISVAGLTTSYAVAEGGSADKLPVLALHGWGGSIDSFWPVAEQLAKSDFTVHVIDFPGFGGTDMPPEPWGVPDYVQFVLAYMDTQGLERVHLLGHSFGGRVSLILGSDHADRVDKMVLANSAGVLPPDNPLRDGAVKAAKSVMRLPGLRKLYEPVRRKAYEQMGATDYLDAGALRETFVKVIEQDLLPFAARVSRPTLLFWGDRDLDTPVWQARQLEQAIPDAGLIIMPGAGHFSYLERLPDYVRIVLHFLTQPAEEGVE